MAIRGRKEGRKEGREKGEFQMASDLCRGWITYRKKERREGKGFWKWSKGGASVKEEEDEEEEEEDEEEEDEE